VEKEFSVLDLDNSLYYLNHMPRRPKFSEAEIIDATGALVAAEGPDAATIGAIGARLEAPSGSIYHRFATRDVLLGRLWLGKAAFFQNRFVAALEAPDARAAGLAAALSIAAAARADFRAARIMLLYRREDFLSEKWPASMTAEAARLGAQVETALRNITRRLCGRVTPRALRIATFAVLDVPLAAVRRHVVANEKPPPVVDELVRSAYGALIPRGRRGS
jgi:AcrR family transcriptional regulator